MIFFKNLLSDTCISSKVSSMTDFKVIGLFALLILPFHSLSADQVLQCKKLETTESFDASKMIAKSHYIYLVKNPQWIDKSNQKDGSDQDINNLDDGSFASGGLWGGEGYQMDVLEVIKGPKISKFFLRGDKPEANREIPSSVSKKASQDSHFDHHNDTIFWQDISAGRIRADDHNCFLPHFSAQENYLIIGGVNSPKAYEVVGQEDDKWLSTVKAIVQNLQKNLDPKQKFQDAIKDFDEKARTG